MLQFVRVTSVLDYISINLMFLYAQKDKEDNELAILCSQGSFRQMV